MKKIIGIALLALMLTGCGEPKVDASNDETMKASIQKVREALPEEKRSEFNHALQVVAMSQLSVKELMQAGMNQDSSVLDSKIRSALNNKTAEDIIDAAAEIKKSRQH